MCGRFALTLPIEAVAKWMEAAEIHGQFDLPRYNITPTSQIASCAHHAGQRHIAPMRWGFIPHWYRTPDDGPLLINARAETVASKPAFREAFARRRCLIPASGFYEWSREGKARQPWFLRPTREPLVAFAGIWQAWHPDPDTRLVTCAIITCQSGPDVSKVHHREPVAIARPGFDSWLAGPPQEAAAQLKPSEPGFYEIHRVSPRVNSGRVEGPELIVPVD